jgi:hypothetical protein
MKNLKAASVSVEGTDPVSCWTYICIYKIKKKKCWIMGGKNHKTINNTEKTLISSEINYFVLFYLELYTFLIFQEEKIWRH